MSPQPKSSTYRRIEPQRGFVLVMSLVFLLLLTILGVTSMTTTSLQEKMASNIKDKTLSIEATESALRHAERWMGSTDVTQFPRKAFVDTIISSASAAAIDDGLNFWDKTTPPVWKTTNWTVSGGDIVDYPNVPLGTFPATALNTSIYASQPRYTIEYLGGQRCSKQLAPGERDYERAPGEQCLLFYVTVRGVGGTTAAVSMLQSSVKVKAQ